MLANLIFLIFTSLVLTSCGGGGNPLGDATDFEDNHGDNSIVRENRAPVLLNPGQQNWTEGAVNVININDADTGTDFDDYGDAISYTCYYDTFVDGVVAKSSECISLGGVSFDANTGSLQWVPDFDQGGVTVGAAAGSISYEFIVTGRDSYFNGPLEDEIIFVGVVNDTNDYPVIDAIGTQSVDEGSMLSVDVADGGDDQDIDTETLSYTCFYDNVVDNNVASTNACSSLTGATFNTSTGVLSWTPDYTMGGNTVGGNEDYEFRVHAYDTYTTADLAPALQGPLTDDEYFDVNVDHVNRPPSLNPMADDSVLEGQALATLDPSDTNGGGDIDFDGEPITYTCYYDQTDNDTVSEIPGNLCSTLTGISFTASTGRLDWTPNFLQAGVYEFVFVGQDNSGEPDDIDRVYTTITVVNVPSVGLTNPVNGIYINATTNSTTYPVDGTCSEAGQTVWIDIDGANAASPVGFVCDGTNYSGTIDTTGFSQGARGFQAFLTDAWTQTVSSNVNTITYDTVYPSIGINSPSEGSYINIASDSASFTFTGTCSENTQTVNGSANGISFSGYSNPTCDGANFNGTFDSTALAEGVLSLTASVSDAAGNVSESVAVSVTRDVTRPTLPNVTIFSNNAGSPLVGKIGDVVTLGIYADEALSATPTVLIAGSAATVTGSASVWTAQYTLVITDPTGLVSINVAYADEASNAGLTVTNTTDGSSVTIDVTPPEINGLTIFSNNSNSALAKVGDIVTVGFVASESLATDPTITVDGQNMTMSGSGTSWTGTYTMAGGENEGTLALTVTYSDLALNAGTPTVATTDGTSVIFDETLPSLGTIEIASDATDTTRSRVGDTITLSLIGTEALLATPTVLVENQTATVTGSGVDWTATYTMTGTDTEGTIDFTVTYYDLASNGAVDSTMTTNGSSVIFDRQVPTLSNVTMYSSNVNPELAAIGDTVTVGIYASEDLLATPNVTLSNQVASVAGGTNVWTATYVMSGVEAEGVLSLSVTFSDLAYNDGVDVLTTTDGSGVEFDNSEPALTNVTIFSNNAYDTSLATTNNTITIGFSSDEDLQVSPTVNVFSNPANVSGSGSTWTATYLLTGLELDGVVDFTITFSDLSGNGPVNATETTDLSSVTFDRTGPDLNVFEVISNNLDTTLAKEGDQVTLSIIGSEALLATPTVLVQSQTATVVGSGVNWTATYTFLLTDAEGVVEHTVTFYDLTGNGAVEVSATTNSSSVRFDVTKPTLPNFTMVSNNTVPTLAKAGDVVTAGIYSSESLQATPTVHVLGGNATLSGSGTVWSATYTIQGSDTEGPVDISITFSDLASNEGVQVLTTTDASNIIFDNTLPTIPNVSILSDNADPTRATVGDTISLGFSGLESLMATPTVEIASFTATVTGGPLHWTASYLMSGLESTGVLDLSITFNDLAGNVGTPTVATTDGSSVNFDQTPPTLPNVTIFSNNADTTRAKVGDTVTIGIYADETLAADPTITVDGQTMSIAGSGSVWTGTYVMAGGESETVLDFTVTYQDTTGNVGTPTVATTDSTSVTFDETLPDLGTIEIATSNTDTVRARAGDTITLSLIGTEALLATPTVLVEDQTATVVGSGVDWTATYVMTGTDTEGVIDFTVMYYDLTSNGVVNSTITTNGSTITFDRQVPTLPNVTMFSSNTDPTFAVVGDTVTVGIYASEALLATPTVLVDGQNMDVFGTSSVWSATYVLTGLETEGVLPFSITFNDLAYNEGVAVTTTTDGSGVDYDNSPPALSNITIFSSNGDSTLAKIADTISIGFYADEDLLASPSVTILSKVATVTGSGAVWTATYDPVTGDGEGVVDFTITFSDLGGNAGTPTTATTDLSQVVFDETDPELNVFEVVSNNTDSTLAKEGDQITLSIIGREVLLATPTVLVQSQTATVVGSGVNWTATYTFLLTDIEGTVEHTVTFYDGAGNGAVEVSATTNSSSVRFDRTKPTLPNFTMVSNNTVPTLAKAGDVVTAGIYSSESLQATPTVHVLGGNATLSGSGTVWSATYTIQGSDTEGPVDISITFSDLASNEGVQVLTTTDASNIIFDNTLPTIPNVSILSDNADPTRATVGDTISLGFSGLESLMATPTVEIASFAATVTGGPLHWTASYLMSGLESTGVLDLSITFNDLAGNVGTPTVATTDGSSVNFDQTPPTLSNVTIFSNNADTTRAKVGDTVTIGIYADETLAADPTITVDGQTMTIAGSGSVWTGTYVMAGGESETVLDFTVTYQDTTGNVGTPTVATTDSSSVIFDETLPSLGTLELASNGTDTTRAKASDIVTLSLIASEALLATPTVMVENQTATVVGSGLDWTATYAFAGTETQGTVDFTVTYYDLTSNGVVMSTITTDGGAVIFDSQIPTLPNVTMSSSNTDSTRAVVGDTITVGIYSSEALLATPSVSLANQGASVTGSGTVWTATYGMLGTEAEGVLALSITFSDLAYNDGVDVLTTTDGSGVDYDNSPPVLENVTIFSNNADTTLATTGNTVTIGFYSDEDLLATPSVLVEGSVANVAGSGSVWSATYGFNGTETDGVVDFTITFSDLGGNAGTPTVATTDSSQVTFDKTAPDITVVEISSNHLNPTWASVGNQISLTLVSNEALMLTPTVKVQSQTAAVTGSGLNWTATYTLIGFEEEAPTEISVTYFDLAGNAGPTETTTTNGSYVIIDMTGPSLSPVTIASSNASPTVAKPGDTITVSFTGDSDLDLTPVVLVDDQTATVTGSATLWSATYVITANENEGVVPFSITYVDLAGNSGNPHDFTTDSSYVVFDKTQPELSNVSILSDNADPTKATVGDTISLGFIGSESLMTTPTVSVSSFSATITGGPVNWTASYLMSGAESPGVLDFTISYNDLAGNVGTPTVATTDGSSVTFDQAPPTLSNVTIFSNNADTTRAKVGDTVTIGIYADETLAADPTITVDGQTMSIAGSGSVWTGTYVMAGGESETVLDFTVTYQDTTGNVGTPTVATTDGSSVTFDETLPSLGTIELATNATDTTRAKAGDTITFSLIGSEALLATPTVLVENQTATVVGSGFDWTATYAFAGTETQGTVDFTVTYYDLTSNGAVDSTMSTNASAVIFDSVVPTLPNVTMFSSNADSTLAVVGDTVTVGIYASEALLATPTASVDSQSMNLTGSSMVWTATYIMTGTENQGALPISITYQDLAYNDGVTTLTTTDATSVRFDTTAPTLTNVVIFSDNSDSSLALVGETITIGFYADEDLLSSPSVTILSQVATVTGSADTWTAVYTTIGGEDEGVVDFSITFSDLGGNAGTLTVNTTDGSSVTFDETDPVLDVYTIASDNTNTVLAKEGNIVTLSIVADEVLMATPTVMVEGQTATVAGSGINWTATYTMLLTDTDGVLEHTVTFYDAAGNGVVTVTETTDSSSVTFDKTKPTLPNFVMTTSNSESTLARPGDVITAGIYADEALLATPTVEVLAQSASLTGSGSVWTATYTLLDTDTEGAVDISITFYDLASNEGVQVLTTTDASGITFDKTEPTLPNISILSDNADPARALVGDTVSLGFVGSESLMLTPTVEIASASATVTGGPLNWTASYTFTGGETDGVVPFSITYNDLAGNVGTPTVATTDSSSVTFDKTQPSLSVVTIFSDNADTTMAKVGNTVTVGLVANEDLAISPTVTVDGQTMTIVGSGVNWTGTYSLVGGENEGVLSLSVTFRDLAGNVGTPTTATTDATTVTFDETLPSLGTIEIASDSTDTTMAKTSDTITLSLIATEALLATPTVLVQGQTATVVGSGFDWTATHTFAGTEDEGIVDFTVTYYDLASNGAVDSTMTTNSSFVTYDREVPTLPNVTMFSSNVDATQAVVGDTVTVGIYASEALLATPTVGLDTVLMSVEGTLTVWTASYALTGTENEGVLALSITFTDLAYNDGVDVLSTTDGTSVSFDDTIPTLTSLTIFSNNSNITKAIVTDQVTIAFTSSEDLAVDPTVTIAAQAMSVTGSGSDWTATYTMAGGEAEGVLSFSVTFNDLAGNPGVDVTSPTDASYVVFDETDPTLSNVTIFSNNANYTTYAKSGDEVYIGFMASETLENTPTVYVDGSVVPSLTGSGAGPWTGTYTFLGGENEGVVNFSITYNDLSGNAGSTVLTTTDSSSVTYDESEPIINPITIASNNTSPTLAYVGDVITLDFTTNETLYQSPTVTLMALTPTVNGYGSWSVTHTLLEAQGAGVVTFTVNVQDLAGNVTSTSATTDGSNVLFDKVEIIGFTEPVNATYGTSSDILFQVIYDEAVVVTGTPSVNFTMDTGGSVSAEYSSGSGSNAIEFKYTVQSGDDDPDGIVLDSNLINLNSGTILSASSVPGELDFTDYLDSLASVLVNTTLNAPDQVTNVVTAPTTSSTTLGVTWDVPNDNGTTITHYSVQYREQGVTVWSQVSPNPTVNSATVQSLTAGITYEIRVAADNGIIGPYSTVQTAEVFSLAGLNIAMWLDASDADYIFTNTGCTTNVTANNDPVACLGDKSGNGNDYIQTTAGYQPTYKTSAVNGLSGIDYDGTGDFLEDDDGENYINGFTAFEFYVVIESDDTNTDSGILDVEDPDNGDDAITLRYDKAGASGGCKECLKGGIARTDSTHRQSETENYTQTTIPQIIGASWESGSKYNIYINGNLSQSWDNGTMTGTVGDATKVIIGKGPKDTGGSKGWDGRILEVIYLNTSITSGDRTTIINYLINKWGIVDPPLLSNVSISSDNAISSSYSIPGDDVTVAFTSTKSLTATPTVNVEGNAATVIGSGTTWTATYTMQSSDGNGNVAFTIDFTDTDGNPGTQVTLVTDGSSVNHDKTVPTLPNVTIFSDNSNTSYAKENDTVTLAFTASENLVSDPTVTVDGQAADSVTGSGANWTATYQLTSGSSETAVAFTIDFNDTQGNGGTQVTAVTDGTSVIYDETPPTLDVVTMYSNNSNNTSYAKVGDVVTVEVTSSEALQATPTIHIGGTSSNVVGSGTSWTGTYTMQSTDITGAIGISITYSDFASNAGTQVNAPTDGSSVTFDKTVPTVTLDAPVDITGSNYTGYDLSGTCSDPGRDVTIDVGGVGTTSTCSGANTWTVVGLNVTAVADTLTVVITADHQDIAANDAITATSTVVKDIVDPGVSSFTCNGNAPVIDGTSSINCSLVMDESVDATTVSSADLTFTVGTVGTPNILSVAPSTGTATTFTIVVDSIDDEVTGTLALELSATSISDPYGNLGPSALTATADITIDTDEPQVSSFTCNGGTTLLDGNSAFNCSITFDQLVPASTIDASDFTILAGSVGTGVIGTVSPGAGNNTTYTIPITGIDDDVDGTFALTLAAGSVEDVNTSPGPSAQTDSVSLVIDTDEIKFTGNMDTTAGDALETQSVTTVFNTLVTGATDISIVEFSIDLDFDDNGTIDPGEIENVLAFQDITSDIDDGLGGFDINDPSTWADYQADEPALGIDFDGTAAGATDLTTANAYTVTLQVTDDAGNETIITSNEWTLSVVSAPSDVTGNYFWLDSSDMDTLYQDAACSITVTSGSDPVLCWGNKGVHGDDFIRDSGAAEYTTTYGTGVGVHFDGDIFIAANVFSETVNDVSVFFVQSEVTNTNSFDFNLNHPHTGGTTGATDARYSVHFPWSNRNLYWDPGGCCTGATRLQAGVPHSVGDTNIYNVVNSNSLGKKQIIHDGDILNENSLVINGYAEDFGFGSNVDNVIHEVIFYRPAPSASERVEIEGYLACKWDIRDQLPASHKYYHATGTDNTGCP